MKPLIVDIYHGNPVSSFSKLKAAGIVGVIHKASQGSGIVDQAYATRRKQALAAGLLWGAYHFFDTSSPVAQADHFLSVAEPDDTTLVSMDWETLNGTPSATAAKQFLEEIEAKLGRKAVIYSGNVAKEQIHGKDEYFGSHRLWLAEYSTSWKVQESWTTPWLWQNNGDSYGPGPHTIPGLNGLVDNSTIVPPMTVEQLVSEWSGFVPTVAAAPVSEPWYDEILKDIENAAGAVGNEIKTI